MQFEALRFRRDPGPGLTPVLDLDPDFAADAHLRAVAEVDEAGRAAGLGRSGFRVGAGCIKRLAPGPFRQADARRRLDRAAVPRRAGMRREEASKDQKGEDRQAHQGGY
jgi:hypothetical protein